MAIVRVWAHPGTGERLINDEWLVNTQTRKIAPAENGSIAHDSSLCLEDFREPGRTAVEAFDGEGHEWLLNLETFQAIPAIAGGDDSLGPLPKIKTCQYHLNCELQNLYVSTESTQLFGVRIIGYCPLIECDYVSYANDPVSVHDRLLLLVAIRQKVFFKKFAEQFVGNGK